MEGVSRGELRCIGRSTPRCEGTEKRSRERETEKKLERHPLFLLALDYKTNASPC